MIKYKKRNNYRSKKFTKKRNPYKAYNNAEWNWDSVFYEINNLKINNKKGYIKIISKKYGINYNTLKYKYYLWNNDKISKINNENRGGSNKIFSDFEEKLIFRHIKVDYIDKNLPLCNEDIKTIAIKQFNILNKDTNIIFNASNGWCNYFKKRWRLSSVTPKISRISTHICSTKEINDFINECIINANVIGHNFFLI